MNGTEKGRHPRPGGEAALSDKMTSFLRFSGLLLLFPILLLSGCKKEKETINWPEGLGGRFVIQISKASGSGPESAVGCYIIDQEGMTKVSDYPSSNVLKWSRDGSFFYKITADHLIMMNHNGTPVKEIKWSDNFIFSDDRTKLAFRRTDNAEMDSVITVNELGSDLTLIRKVPRNPDRQTMLSGFSPGKTEISFNKHVRIDYDTYDSIGILSAGEYSVLAEGIDPAWSPDGTKLFYINGNALWECARSSHSTRKLCDLPGLMYRWGNWSPDRSRMIYLTTEGAALALYITSPGTGTSKKVTGFFFDSITEHACWSSDGTKIALGINPDKIIVINADGTNPVILELKKSITYHGYEYIESFDWYY